jgi:hypothetical protein
MKTAPRLLFILAALLLAGPSASAETRRVTDDGSLRRALRDLEPGDVVEIAPGRYRGGLVLRDVSGKEKNRIVIRGSDKDDPPEFRGGGIEGWHLVDCNYVTLANMRVRGFRGNGINADDGGSFDTPSAGIVLEDLAVLETGPKGNHDGIKLSGLVDFAVRRCRIEGWGGSAIDMVGCHRGVIEDCHVEGKPGHTNHSGVQLKGGTSEVLVQTSFFKGVTHRSVNLGGSTGLRYFRPKAEGYEATKIVVAGNRFVGSQAPVAFVTARGGAFRYNTIYRPDKWVFRILQEQPTPKFDPCQRGVFEHNLVVTRRGFRINIGPNTKPDTFTFKNNLWHDAHGNRPRLPAKEAGGIYNIDPKLENAATPEMRPTAEDEALKTVGAHAWERKELGEVAW